MRSGKTQVGVEDRHGVISDGAHWKAQGYQQFADSQLAGLNLDRNSFRGNIEQIPNTEKKPHI